MVKSLYTLAKAVRLRQWVKNLTIFAAVVFTGRLFVVSASDPFPILTSELFITIGAFWVFCALSGGMYLLNDIIDVPKDRLHPFKKNRPIASGAMSIPFALTVSICLLTSAVISALLFFPFAFFLVVVAFLAIQFSYTFFLKHISLLDVLAIASLFIIRVYAGEAATGLHINIWLFLTVVSAALFLALGKRRSEITLLTDEMGNLKIKTRETLSHYSEKMMDVYLSMFATSTWLSYALYSFLIKPPTIRRTVNEFFMDNNLLMTADRKWLMVTIPFVIYGIMRYLQLIYEKHQGESPEKVLLSDKPLIIDIALWGIVVVGIIYVIGR